MRVRSPRTKEPGPFLAVLFLGFTVGLSSCTKAQCAAHCSDQLLIKLSQPVVNSDRFSVQINGLTYPLSYYGDPPPDGVDEYRANRIQVLDFHKTDALSVRWLIDGSLWFERTLRPTWTHSEVCGLDCYSGETFLDLPTTLPDGADLDDLPRPCTTMGCTDRVLIHLVQPVAWQPAMAVEVDGGPCVLSGCSVDRSRSRCVVTSLATSDTRTCSDAPSEVDAVVVRTDLPSVTLAWYVERSSWFSVTVNPSYGPGIYPVGVACAPACQHGDVSIALPTPPPVLDASLDR